MKIIRVHSIQPMKTVDVNRNLISGRQCGLLTVNRILDDGLGNTAR